MSMCMCVCILSLGLRGVIVCLSADLTAGFRCSHFVRVCVCGVTSAELGGFSARFSLLSPVTASWKSNSQHTVTHVMTETCLL